MSTMRSLVRHAERARGKRKPVGRMKGWMNQINRSRALKNKKPDHGGFMQSIFATLLGAKIRQAKAK